MSNMKRSELTLPVYFDRYINEADDVTLTEALEMSLHELENTAVAIWKSLGDKVYAPGKWTLRDILQHIIDTERVFSYRALSFARGEATVQPFDEDGYAVNAGAINRDWDDLLNEAIIVRKSTISLFNSFTTEMLAKLGMGFKGEYAVHAIGFILVGHQRWHFRVINEKYIPLI